MKCANGCRRFAAVFASLALLCAVDACAGYQAPSESVRPEILRVLFDDAVAAARGLKGTVRYAFLRDLATLQVGSGDKDEPRATIQLAVEAIPGIADAYERLWRACEIAFLRVRVGDRAAGLEMCRNAMVRARTSGGPRVSTTLAALLAYAGDLAGSREMIESSPKGSDPVNTYHAIVILLASIEDGRIVNLAGAREMAAQIGSPEGRCDALSFIAVGQARVGDRVGSAATFAQAKAELRSITDKSRRELLLIHIARWQALGDIDAARATADEISGVSRDIALVEVAIIQANTGDLPGAEATAASVADDAVRGRADSTIAMAKARAGDVEATKAAAKRIVNDSERDRFLLNAAHALVRAGKVEAAKSLTAEALSPVFKEQVNAAVLDAEARTLADAGDVSGAVALTAGLSADPFRRSFSGIAVARAKAGDLAGIAEMRELLPTDRVGDFYLAILKELLPKGNDFKIMLGGA